MNKKSVLVLVFVVLVVLRLFPEENEPFEVVKTPTIMEVGGFWNVYMEFNVPLSRIKEKMGYFRDECRKQGIQSNRVITIYYNWSEQADAMIRWDMAYIVPGDTRVTPPLKMKKFEIMKAVIYTHTGSSQVEEIVKSWDILRNYMKKKNLKIVWPNYEIHYKNSTRMDLIYRLEK
jgi:effector-binding domain-containing protein